MARRRPRWYWSPAGKTDGRYVIVTLTSEQLRAIGVPAFYPIALHDGDVLVRRFPNEHQAIAYVDTLPKGLT